MKQLICTPGRIRTFIIGFGDRYATIAPLTHFEGWENFEISTRCLTNSRSASELPTQLIFVGHYGIEPYPTTERFYRPLITPVTEASQYWSE